MEGGAISDERGTPVIWLAVSDAKKDGQAAEAKAVLSVMAAEKDTLQRRLRDAETLVCRLTGKNACIGLIINSRRC